MLPSVLTSSPIDGLRLKGTCGSLGRSGVVSDISFSNVTVLVLGTLSTLISAGREF